jgi:uncharacterized DUF497 family protein
MKIEKIIWDEKTVDHIAGHGVTPEEVEEIFFSEEDNPVILKGKEGRYLTYGQTRSGRYLLVVWAVRYKKTGIITARDLTKKEKQFYRRTKR